METEFGIAVAAVLTVATVLMVIDNAAAAAVNNSDDAKYKKTLRRKTMKNVFRIAVAAVLTVATVLMVNGFFAAHDVYAAVEKASPDYSEVTVDLIDELTTGSAITIDAMVDITAEDFEDGGTDDNSLVITQTLNCTEAAGGTDDYTMLDMKLTTTDVTGYDTTYFMYAVDDTVEKFSVTAAGLLKAVGGASFGENDLDDIADVGCDSISADGSEISVDSKLVTAQEFTWHVGPYDFTDATTNTVTVVHAEGAAEPSNINEALYAPVMTPYNVFGGTVVIDQITVYYQTNASGDDFDFALIATDQDASLTEAAGEDNIGNGATGASSETILSADYTMTDFAHWVEIDINNTDAITDVQIYDIKIEAHLE